MGEQISFFSEEAGGLEQAITKINDRKNYAILKKDLDVFTWRELQDIYYGMNNISIPHEIGLMLNPVERFSICMAVGAIKRSPSNHAEYRVTFTNFENLISKLNKISYEGSHRLRTLRQTAYNPLPAKPGDQQKRMYALDEDVKERFVNSFMEEYVSPDHEEPGSHWRDPAYEGLNRNRKPKFSKSKRAYIDAIFIGIENMYKNNMR